MIEVLIKDKIFGFEEFNNAIYFEEDELGFLCFANDYCFVLKKTDKDIVEKIYRKYIKNGTLFNILNLIEDKGETIVTQNLKAPVYIDFNKKIAGQIIVEEDLPVRDILLTNHRL